MGVSLDQRVLQRIGAEFLVKAQFLSLRSDDTYVRSAERRSPGPRSLETSRR
jgi:hypothetical protein